MQGSRATALTRRGLAAAALGVAIGVAGLAMSNLRDLLQRAKFRGVLSTPLAPSPPEIGTKLILPAHVGLPTTAFLLVILPSCKNCGTAKVSSALLGKPRSIPTVLCLVDPPSWYDEELTPLIKQYPVIAGNAAATLPYELLALSPCAVIVDENHTLERYVASDDINEFLRGAN